MNIRRAVAGQGVVHVHVESRSMLNTGNTSVLAKIGASVFNYCI